MLNVLHRSKANPFSCNLAVTSAVIAGGITILGMPAHAQSIDWADSISPAFFAQIDTNTAGDVFSITMDPGGFNIVNSTGVPGFPDGITNQLIAPHTTNFLIDDATLSPTFAVYTNTTDLVWNWTNGTSLGVKAGAVFNVTKVGNSAVVDLAIPVDPALVINNTGLTSLVGSSSFTANSTLTSASYSGNTAFVPTSQVPGPLPILGAGIAFGYTRRLRNRIKSSVG